RGRPYCRRSALSVLRSAAEPHDRGGRDELQLGLGDRQCPAAAWCEIVAERIPSAVVLLAIIGGLTLSIVIPAYNEERRLPCTLDAILTWLDGSAFADAEVLVVDDGSSDGTAALVEARSA